MIWTDVRFPTGEGREPMTAHAASADLKQTRQVNIMVLFSGKD